ncbi:Bug family tripartite tricarboxylate transporter substrate binding protein [Nocardioides sp. NPDC057577]|uniref:Bug family tripartite tricarboxylate transporter substrate binding protein n=1 Tax=Nocardioides sp. NPDC057577 TaxID=3346171 RepID=UPI0036732BEF
MRKLAKTKSVALLTATLIGASALTSCGADGSTATPADSPLAKGASIVVPSDPGGGYDQTARAMEKVLTDEGIAKRVQVTNTPGAGGTVALSQYVQGNDASDLMVAGKALVGAVLTNKADNKLSEATPIARLIGEYEVVVVPADSKFETLEDFLAALKADPGENPIAIGNQGGVDHQWGGILAQEVGVNPTDVNFVTYDGGAEVTTAMLGGRVAAGISGYAEFAEQVEAGKLKVLASSSDAPLEVNPDIPTITDAGYPDAVFVNWRGIFAPPGISESDRKDLDEAFKTMNDSEAWAKVRETNGWTDEYLGTDEFEAQLEKDEAEAETQLKELGLA